MPLPRALFRDRRDGETGFLQPGHLYAIARILMKNQKLQRPWFFGFDEVGSTE